MLLPSPRSAVCIIATRVEAREFGKAASSCLSPPKNTSLAQQGLPVASSRTTSLSRQCYCLPRGRRSASSLRASSRVSLARRQAPACPHLRTHLSLNKDCPWPRPVQLPSVGNVIAFPEVGGLHHRYERRAA